MEQTMSRELMIVSVTLSDRTDGGIRATSRDLPGLLLSGANKHAICDAIAPAIRTLLEHKGYQIVSVKPGRPFAEALAKPSPREVDMHIQQFVVELAEAA
ncbi:hypothetical protein CRBSH125_01460 [Afipia carboxidovorans]|nr:hypothetical protein CRBSH125_01460 [Afipia carboxidovorans]